LVPESKKSVLTQKKSFWVRKGKVKIKSFEKSGNETEGKFIEGGCEQRCNSVWVVTTNDSALSASQALVRGPLGFSSSKKKA